MKNKKHLSIQLTNIQYLPVMVGLVSGVAFIVLFIIWSNQPAGSGKFVSQSEAINAVTERYPFLGDDNLEPKFGYVKYRGVGIGVDYS